MTPSEITATAVRLLASLAAVAAFAWTWHSAVETADRQADRSVCQAEQTCP